MRTVRRLFSHHRSLTVLAISTLAVALGLAAALASVAEAILLRPLPVARPEQVVRIFTASDTQPLGLVSYPDFEDFRRASRTLAGMAAQSQVLLAIGTAPAEMRLALAVTLDYFDVLGVPVAPGRGFRFVEARDAVVILSYDYWQSHFSADPRVVGRRILICGGAFTIIGIAPKNFGLDRFIHEDLYLPIGVYEAGLLPATGQPLQDRSRRYLSVYARLARGKIAEARTELAAISAGLASRYPADRGQRALVLTELEARTANDRAMPALAAVLGALAALILLIASANVVMLLLARSQARAREIAIRIALGASPAHLLRSNLIESAALTLAGATLAIPIAVFAGKLLAHAATLPTDFRFSIVPNIDGHLSLIFIAVTVVISLICGVLPAHRTAPSTRPRHAFAAIQIALATALIASSGFLFGGIQTVTRADAGYRTECVLVLALDPSQVRCNEAQGRGFYDQVLARVRALPGVRLADVAQSVPLGYTSAQRQVVVGDETLTLWMNIVGPRYFELLHLPIFEGRGFGESDSASAPLVAIVNQELAKRCGVGCAFQMNGHQVRVIGVARTIGYFSPNEPPRPYFYLPFSQNYAGRMILHVETAGDPAALAHAVAGEIHLLDPAQPISGIRPLSDYLNQGAMFQPRIALRILGVAAIVGIGLSLTGLYGVIAHVAARRRREFAIRIALGATKAQVICLLAASGLKVVLSGVALGLLIATAALALLRHLIPTEGASWNLALAAAIVVLVAIPAFLIPARKAALLDPAHLLRAE